MAHKCISKNCPFNDINPDGCHFIAVCVYAVKQLTNADRIRAMSDEELAQWMLRYQRQIIKETLRILGTDEHVAAFEEALGEKPDCTDLVKWLKEPYMEVI